MSDTLLELRSITKSYPGVQALRGVDLSVGAVAAISGAAAATFIDGSTQPDAVTTVLVAVAIAMVLAVA